ncbi:mitochondrial carrier homolog 2-like [Artemia franciscana]|uniref:mitochondrial carrier homolog 2-like n=1 Tax=Artemia franciscana TaxID=6661 RepID=UPI0032DB93F7
MVVTARMCAQFVGRESLYTWCGDRLYSGEDWGIRSSFRDIFLREGIQGLFAGITPRLIGEALVVVISGPLATAINRSNQFVEPRWIRRFASFSFRAVVKGAFLHPFRVVSTTMSVNRSR